MTPAEKKGISCIFHFKFGHCKSGDSCEFSHTKKPENSTKGKGKGKESGKGKQPKGTPAKAAANPVSGGVAAISGLVGLPVGASAASTASAEDTTVTSTPTVALAAQLCAAVGTVAKSLKIPKLVKLASVVCSANRRRALPSTSNGLMIQEQVDT